jgi:hypothetical protein
MASEPAWSTDTTGNREADATNAPEPSKCNLIFLLQHDRRICSAPGFVSFDAGPFWVDWKFLHRLTVWTLDSSPSAGRRDPRRTLPQAKLVIIDHAGHDASKASITRELIRATSLQCSEQSYRAVGVTQNSQGVRRCRDEPIQCALQGRQPRKRSSLGSRNAVDQNLVTKTL